MRKFSISLILILLTTYTNAFEFSWQLDETPEGSESTTHVEPVEVILHDEVVEVPAHSASLALLRKYSIHLTPDFTPDYAYRLLKTFESIPQPRNEYYHKDTPSVEPSLWQLTDRNVHNDITVEYEDGTRIVTLAAEAFRYATPLLASIDGVRGRYFSKRLHRAVVRFVTDNGADRQRINNILYDRYTVSVNVPDYTELMKYTTQEDAGRFDDFKNEELIAIVAMLEEFPSGMLKTPGLKYLVRRRDGLSHPLYPGAPAVAWPKSGYIEFMESAFKAQGLNYIHRLILHEKAHFLWEHLFDAQLKADWIQLGGWYLNPDDPDGWSTTKQTEFVSAYAHGKNPNEDMAESISFYIVNPDKLRSRSPAKYAFIQNRVMHGTRYISQIRQDLTFEVYNLYPDYVYPGRITAIDIKVEGAPEADKKITIDLQLYGESDLDTASRGDARVYSEKGTYMGIWFYPIDKNGQHTTDSHRLRGISHLSRYAASGHWMIEQIAISDMNGNTRYHGIDDFGWRLYIDNPLADYEPPQYVPNSMRLSLSEASTDRGERYQIITARWKVIEGNEIQWVSASINDQNNETYSRFDYGRYDAETDTVFVDLVIADYMQSGVYEIAEIGMADVAGNIIGIYFGDPGWGLYDTDTITDEPPVTIKIETQFPDSTPPELDINNITIKAEPTRPHDPNGETNVYITFRIRDDISGLHDADIILRDPLGGTPRWHYWVSSRAFHSLYFIGEPTVWKTYEHRIQLPAGSIPGTWGLAGMTVKDKAGNNQRYDFTEIVQFEIEDKSVYDLNADGTVNIQDLVLVANEIGNPGPSEAADVNNDGTVNILDLVSVASAF